MRSGLLSLGVPAPSFLTPCWPLDSREAMAAGLEQSYPIYQWLGLDHVEHQTLHRGLTDRLLLVHVHGFL